MFALPFAILVLCAGTVAAGSLSNYRTVASLGALLNRFDVLIQVLGYVLVGSFFSAMGFKLGLSKSPDARRRLRFLYWGATAAFVPVLLPSLYARLQGRDLSEVFPSWLIAVMLIPLVLFPLTLS